MTAPLDPQPEPETTPAGSPPDPSPPIHRGLGPMPRVRAAAVAVAAALVITCLLVLDPLTAALVGAAGCLVLVAVTVIDLEELRVPNRIIEPAIIAALVASTALHPSVEWLLAALGAGGFFLVAALVYPAGLGLGDVRLATFLGAWLGRDVVVALFAGSFAALVPAVVILARHGRAGRKMAIPFAPFLALGGVVALFAGDAVLDWYLGS